MLSLLNFINKNNIIIHINVRNFIEYAGNSDVNYKNDIIGQPRHTILILVSACGYFELVKYLVTHGANINDSTCIGANALWHASTRGHIDIVKYLVKHNARITNNILEYTVYFKQTKVVKYLIKHGVNITTTRQLNNYIHKIVFKRIKI